MINILFTILLVEGFVTISVEILTIRQLLPFFGGSVLITSLIIGVFLLFLAIGYWRGGGHKQDYYQKLNQNFIISMLWLGIGMNYLFIALFSQLTIINLSFPFLVSLSLYLLLILAPIVYCLGQTIPLTTNLFNQEQRVGKISGSALFISTLGSFLGAIVTSLLLFHYLGVAWTVVINCLLLFTLTVLLHKHSKLTWWVYLILAVMLYFIKVINIDVENQLFKLTNNYANYRVTDIDINARALEINLSSSSMLTSKNEGYAYIEYIKDVLFNQLKLRHRDILIIGAGGFTLTAAGTFDNQIVYVDIDPGIKKLAETHFLKQPVNGLFVGQDARQFLLNNKQLFDVIVSDVYSNQITIPQSLLTTDYFQMVSNHLKPGGLMVINVVANPLFDNNYSRRTHNTIQKVFSFCTISPIDWKNVTNLIYICTKQPQDNQHYTDNLSSSTLDSFDSNQGLKK